MFTRKELTEWTSALRKNPEQQITGTLASDNYTKFCCLGKLCEVRGVKRKGNPSSGIGYQWGNRLAKNYLPADLAEELTGNPDNYRVHFSWFDMPLLNGCVSAAEANDGGRTWIEIADHFDKYYPCSDEKEGEDEKA